MELHDIDSIFKKVVDGSSNYYDAEAHLAKASIWQQVQVKKKVQLSPILFRLLVAACILLLLCTTTLSISFFKARKSMQTLVETNDALKNNLTGNSQNALAAKAVSPIVKANAHSTDTVYREKKVIVYQSVMSTVKIVDTVYVKQLVYVEKESSPEITASKKNSATADSLAPKSGQKNYKKEILITDNTSIQKNKKSKIQIRFWGSKNQENNGTLAFSTKL